MTRWAATGACASPASSTGACSSPPRTSILLEEVCGHHAVQPFLDGVRLGDKVQIKADERGFVKQALIKIGFPVEDLAGYVTGDPLPLALRDQMLGGDAFALRDYQNEAVASFYAGGGERAAPASSSSPAAPGRPWSASAPWRASSPHPHPHHQHHRPAPVAR
jgi:hypothetical protein